MTRLAFLVPAGIALVLGVVGGTLLLGQPGAGFGLRLAEQHGPLMVFGFLGTLIALERAVALRRPSALAVPGLLGLGGILIVTPIPEWIGQFSLIAGLLGLLVLYTAIRRRQASLATEVQALGAAAGIAAAVLWTGGLVVERILPLLAAFLVLTIVGERIELARVQVLPVAAPPVAMAASISLAAAALVAAPFPSLGIPMAGLSLLALVAWLWRFDIARRRLGVPGLPRYVAGCLLAGYGWLVVVAGVWMLASVPLPQRAYDASVHAVFAGFVLSMVFAHAPIVLPAVLRIRLPYHPVLVIPVLLLHLGLIIRVVLGDGRGVEGAVAVGAWVMVAALLCFVVTAIVLATLARRPEEMSDS